ncbi:MAG TPA: phage tail protein [Noviherbaspirillum sp.]|nr:phage tail protein [Noviherbaspirillum sp.]
MAVSLPNGITIALATAYGSALTVTALTNANPAVATSTAHGLSNGDYVVVTSGWAKLNNRVVRVSGVTANTFNLEGYDTSSTTDYPAGSGTGSVQKVTTWTQITQILDCQTSGGDMQFTSYSFLEQDFETQLPTQASPQTITLSIADDPSQTGYTTLKTAAEARATRASKITFPNSAIALYNGYVGFNETPSMTKNQVMAVQATLSLLSRPVRYAS